MNFSLIRLRIAASILGCILHSRSSFRCFTLQTRKHLESWKQLQCYHDREHVAQSENAWMMLYHAGELSTKQLLSHSQHDSSRGCYWLYLKWVRIVQLSLTG